MEQRAKRDKLSPEQISRLDPLGFVWDPFQTGWEEGFSHLEKFFQTEGHARVTSGFETEDGYKLSTWVGTQRGDKDKLSPERKARLDSLGFIWDANEADWENGFSNLEKFFSARRAC